MRIVKDNYHDRPAKLVVAEALRTLAAWLGIYYTIRAISWLAAGQILLETMDIVWPFVACSAVAHFTILGRGWTDAAWNQGRNFTFAVYTLAVDASSKDKSGRLNLRAIERELASLDDQELIEEEQDAHCEKCDQLLVDEYSMCPICKTPGKERVDGDKEPSGAN